MKATIRSRHESMWRILLALLVGMAVIALAAGSDRERFDDSRPTENIVAPQQLLAIRSDKVLREKPAVEIILPKTRSPNRYETPREPIRIKDAPTIKPQWYDGLWDNPRSVFEFGRMV